MSEEFAQTTLAMPPIEELYMEPKRKTGKLALIIVLSVVGVLLVAAIASFFGARWYYQDKTYPGVQFAGASVSGQTRDQLESTVQDAIEQTKIVISDTDGVSATASLANLGVTVDVDATVDDLMNAKRDGDVLAALGSVNPFVHHQVGLNAKTNNLDMSTYVAQQFVGEDERAVPSTIAYNGDAHTFQAVEGRGGRSPKTNKVNDAIKQAISMPGSTVKALVTYEDVGMPISVDAANQAANDANVRLNAKIVFNNGQGKAFEIPVDSIASFIKTDGDVEQGVITLNYDEDAITSYVEQEVPNHLNQQKVSQEDAVDDSGTVLATVVKGQNGVTVKNVDNLVPQVVQALQSGQGATMQVEGDVQQFDVVQKKSEYRIVVDLSSQTATVYKGNDQVKQFLVCTGTPGKHSTDPGTYYIYLKYNVQDMTGLNDDGSRYLSKGVKWVGYFHGGEGFHTASWNSYGIAHGDPKNYGSHGCVNMYEQDAKWIYDNCTEGTIVQVVGTEPDGPVR